MGWAAGGETPRGGRYYGSQSAHSFFAQQLRALQKMPLPGLHFPLPSWTDLSSAIHVAAVVGFRRSAARFASQTLNCRLICSFEIYANKTIAVVMRGAQRLLCDTTPAALGVTAEKA